MSGPAGVWDHEAAAGYRSAGLTHGREHFTYRVAARRRAARASGPSDCDLLRTGDE